MSRRYSTEHKEFLYQYIPGHHHADTARTFTEKWPDTPMTADQVKAWSQNHHIPCGRHFDGHPSKFPKEIRDFIAENYKDRGNKELWQMIRARFGPAMTIKQVKTYKKNHNLDSGLSGYFQKGHEPANKGKTWDEIMSKESQERSLKTCFKKGHVPHNHHSIGTVVMTTDGYLARKIGEPNSWEFVHRAEWEKHNGPIPDRMMVTFKDGNHENCDISNLKLISREENAVLNKLRLRYDDANLTESGILVAKVLLAANKRRVKR